MKHKYIESLLTEIQQLEKRVANLNENQKVPFSFFKESFKRTQEISRLLHELEFVQIEDMKEQMEKLVLFLSEAENSKEKTKPTPIATVAESDKAKVSSDKKEQITIKTDATEKVVSPVGVTEKQDKPIFSHVATIETAQGTAQLNAPIFSQQSETIVDHLSPKNKSLNDVQPTNHTIQDAKRSISLNDRFLFQRELFDNKREAMNVMLTKLQSFSSFEVTKNYLEENTNWNFNDETVDKFMQMLKESFK